MADPKAKAPLVAVDSATEAQGGLGGKVWWLALTCGHVIKRRGPVPERARCAECGKRLSDG